MSEAYRTVLENGLRVVTAPRAGTRSLAMGVLVESGAVNESEGTTGIAHLCEHLLFQGTSNRGAFEIAMVMDAAGGRLGAFTSRDYTCYYASVLDQYFPLAIDLLGDILLNPTFPPEALEREKRAIGCEIQANWDDPSRRVDQLLRRAVWPDHPLGRPIPGESEDLRRLTREDLIYFVHSTYLPARMIVSAAGNVQHEDFVAEVRDAFWRLIGDNSLVIRTRPHFRPAVRLESAPVAQAYFALGLAAPAYTDSRRYTMHVLNELLGAGISSRLYRRLREEEGLVYAIDSSYRAYRDAGMLVVAGSTSPRHLHRVLGHAISELGALLRWESPVEEEELRRAKVRLESELLLASEDPQALMSRLATQELYFGRPIELEAMLGEVAAVDREGLRRLALDTLEEGLGQAGLAVVAPRAPHHYTSSSLEGLMDDLRQPRPSPAPEVEPDVAAEGVSQRQLVERR